MRLSILFVAETSIKHSILYNKFRILHGGAKIWILSLSGENDILLIRFVHS